MGWRPNSMISGGAMMRYIMRWNEEKQELVKVAVEDALYDELGSLSPETKKSMDEAFPDADSSDKANMLYDLYSGE